MLAINDLKRSNTNIENELTNAVTRVIHSGWYILGPEVKAFEEEFANYCQVNHCISVANGTEALELAIRALDIEPNDEIITVANAGMYSTNAILANLAKPIYADVDLMSMTISPTSISENISNKTKAIIVTHLYGQLADISAILAIANQYKIPVIEDCAQAHGAMKNGKKAGSFGDIACFSFYPTKNLGALGDGGAVITSNAKLAARVKQLRQYGWENKYQVEISGGKNTRLDEMQAAILRVKLKYLDAENQRRREIVSLYNSYFQDLEFQLPENIDESYVAHLYVIRSDERNEIKDHLRKKNVGAEIHYPIPDYRQTILQNVYENLFLPNTENITQKILTLPCFPAMKNEEIKMIAEVCKDSLSCKI